MRDENKKMLKCTRWKKTKRPDLPYWSYLTHHHIGGITKCELHSWLQDNINSRSGLRKWSAKSQASVPSCNRPQHQQSKIHHSFAPAPVFLANNVACNTYSTCFRPSIHLLWALWLGLLRLNYINMFLRTEIIYDICTISITNYYKHQ